MVLEDDVVPNNARDPAIAVGRLRRENREGEEENPKRDRGFVAGSALLTVDD